MAEVMHFVAEFLWAFAFGMGWWALVKGDLWRHPFGH